MDTMGFKFSIEQSKYTKNPDDISTALKVVNFLNLSVKVSAGFLERRWQQQKVLKNNGIDWFEKIFAYPLTSPA